MPDDPNVSRLFDMLVTMQSDLHYLLLDTAASNSDTSEQVAALRADVLEVKAELDALRSDVGHTLDEHDDRLDQVDRDRSRLAGILSVVGSAGGAAGAWLANLFSG